MTIAVVTDSSAQLSSAECDERNIRVVPITIVIDGVPYLDGVELDVDTFYDRLRDGIQLSTSQPSPGQFLEVWKAAADGGATEIVSVHVGDSVSGALNAARLAATDAPVPVTLVDSNMTSYGVGVLTMAVADWVRSRGSTEGVVEFASRQVATIGTTFILQDLRWVMRGGRMRAATLPTGQTDVPVLAGMGGGYQLVGTGRTVDELIAAMAEQMTSGERRRHVAVALAAPDTAPYADGLVALLSDHPRVESVRRYRMGPAIAVHTGPGTAGGFWWPVDDAGAGG